MCVQQVEIIKHQDLAIERRASLQGKSHMPKSHYGCALSNKHKMLDGPTDNVIDFRLSLTILLPVFSQDKYDLKRPLAMAQPRGVDLSVIIR